MSGVGVFGSLSVSILLSRILVTLILVKLILVTLIVVTLILVTLTDTTTWQSKNVCCGDEAFSALRTGGPIVQLSTKVPSNMSTWIQSAPEDMAIEISEARQEKSAARIDADMTNFLWPFSFNITGFKLGEQEGDTAG